MIFSHHEIQELIKLIDYKHLLFIGSNLGTDLLTDSDREVLSGYGIDINNIPQKQMVEQAHAFGLLSEVLSKKDANSITFNNLKDYLKKPSNVIPLSVKDKTIIDTIKHQTYGYIRGLGNTVGKSLTQVHIEASKNQREIYEKLIKQELTQGAKDKLGIQEIVSNLGHLTGDWARDFGRIVETESNNAYQEGRATSIEHFFGSEQEVYKEVYPGACKHCIKAYLTAGPGSEPKIFKLTTLQANGNNYGLKVADWKPIIGSHHPHCRCHLHRKPKGYTWNPSSQSFSTVVKYEPKVKRKSKIQIQVGDKDFEI